MAAISDYAGPTPDHFTNVRALNSAYLDATSDMKRPQKGRLQDAPFLLFSVREMDLQWWRDVMQLDPQFDLLDQMPKLSADLSALQTAAIGFLWQLARENPYAARIVSGASIAWCELLTELPLVTILNRVGGRHDLLLARFQSTAGSQCRMLTDGAGSRSPSRRAAHIAELQKMLTNSSQVEYPRIASAACAMPAVSFNVAEKRLRKSRMKKL